MVNYSICAIGSISYAGYWAVNQSIGKDIVVTIFKRHVLQCVAYILCNLYLFIGTFLAIFNPDLIKIDHSLASLYGDEAPVWLRVTKLLFMMQGFIMPLVRLSEPALFRVMFNSISDTCCFCLKAKEES